MVKSLVMTWLAVALSFWLGSAQETCTDCDVPEESVLLQKAKAGDLGPYSYDDHHYAPVSPAWRCAPDVNAAQYQWKLLILSISSTYAEEGDFVQVAKDGIAELYGYDIGNVLFKPTQAVEQPFRVTPQGALSYFVGNEAAGPVDGIPEDKGFAIAGGDTWSKVRFDNDQIYCVTEYLAFAEGYYYFTNAKTNVTTGVEYSFGYEKLEDGKLKIILHHSSIPYSPPSLMQEKNQEKNQEKAMLNKATAAEEPISKGHKWHPPPGGRCTPAINAAQYAWKLLILSISQTYAEEGDFVQVAKDGIAALYGYDVGNVLFKPTQAVEQPFRVTPQGALSYFVGNEAAGPVDGIPEDKGFAIAGGDTWSKVRFDNDQIYCVTETLAFAEGYYYFTNAKTNVTTGVEYSFGYEKLEDGTLKIILHHSSIPYSPPAPPSLMQEKNQEKAMLKKATAAGEPISKGYKWHPPPGGRCTPAINAAQYAWKLLILSISQTYAEEGDFVQVAKDGIAALYGYDVGNVLFKPTQAVEQPFRVTKQGALSYFVGADAAGPVDGIPEDKGFAIAGGDTWEKVRFDNDQIYCLGSIAIAEGYYYFTNAKTKAIAAVEYSFGYENIEGEWKIFLHHSSIPFSP